MLNRQYLNKGTGNSTMRAMPVRDEEYFDFKLFKLDSVKTYEEGLKVLSKMDNAITGMEHKIARSESKGDGDADWRQRIDFALKKAKISRQELQNRLPLLRKSDSESKFIQAARELLDPSVFEVIENRARQI